MALFFALGGEDALIRVEARVKRLKLLSCSTETSQSTGFLSSA